MKNNLILSLIMGAVLITGCSQDVQMYVPQENKAAAEQFYLKVYSQTMDKSWSYAQDYASKAVLTVYGVPVTYSIKELEKRP